MLPPTTSGRMPREPPEDRPPLSELAPWMPSKKGYWCCRSIVNLFYLISSLLLLVYIMVFGLLMFIFEIPKMFLRIFLRAGMSGFGMIVEHAYALPICKLHVVISRAVQQRWGRRRYHSRYLDIRTELSFDGEEGSCCFVHAIPCLTDNYCYLIIDASVESSKAAAEGHTGLPCCVVDPCDAGAVVAALTLLSDKHYAAFGGLSLEAVLCTHKHWDHAGGNTDLIRLAAAQSRESDEGDARRGAAESAGEGESDGAQPLARLRLVHPMRVYAGEDEDAPGCTDPVRHGEHMQVGALFFEALAAPGHTVGSLMYRLATPVSHVDDRPGEGQLEAAFAGSSSSSSPAGLRMDVLFTGDTLFSGGCGAQFEGCDLDIEHCFATMLAEVSLPDALLFPGHEYTSHLLEGRVKESLDTWGPVEPPGQFLAFCGAYYVAAHRRANRDKVPTVPCTLASERLLNPHFDRGLRRYAEIVLALLDAQATPDGAAALTDEAPPAAAVMDAPGGAEGAGAASAGAQGADAAGAGGGGMSERRLPLLQHAAGPSSSQRPAPRAAAPPLPQAVPPRPGSPQAGQLSGGGTEGGDEGIKDKERQSHFITGTAPPAFQFAFLYRTELEELRSALLEGTMSGPDAAAKLLEMEKRVFANPLLTGGKDRFDDGGLTPLEELQANSLGKLPLPPPPVEETPETDDARNSDEASSEETSVDTEEPADTTEAALRRLAHLPGQEITTAALKVLGVLPQVPVGPKAPVADEDMPVCLNRLERVLKELGAPEASLEALRKLFEKDGLAGEDAEVAGCCWPGGSVSPSDGTSDDGVRKVFAVRTSEASGRLARSVLPLKRVLQSLRPMPVQRPEPVCCSVEPCLSDLRKWRRWCRRCCRSRRPPRDKSAGQGQRRQSWDPSDDAGAEEESQALRDNEFEPDRLPSPHQLEKDSRQRMFLAENCFSAHTLDRCSLCTGGFRARRRQLLAEVPPL
mmetsp:Transcript_50438/g.163210  ORF Transcript_50438/g.163210 Transcript_50438/m.163210 type:complete len:970 (+) Transcript_50438:124-3033(+)